MKRRQRPNHAERGATLILVLFIVTVVSVVLAAVLSNADTNVRATVALRDQASANYGADGAAEAMLNALKTSGINCSSPTNPTYEKQLGSAGNPFYVPASSNKGPLDAYGRCTLDQIHGLSSTTSVSASTSISQPPPVTSTAPYLGAGDPTLPSYAVLTTGKGASDFGFDVSPSAGTNTVIYVENGSIGSNKDINASGLCLDVRLQGTGTYNANCSKATGIGTGVDSTTGTRLVVKAENTCIGGSAAYTPTACEPGSSDVAAPPAPDLPGQITATNPPAQCLTTGKGGNAVTYAALSPGLYTNVAILNNPCSSAVNWEWLMPGAYYFNYGSTPWQWPNRLIGGTPLNGTTKITTLAGLANANNSPGACDDPAHPIGASVNGVSLVFGGSSTVAANTNSGSAAELCANSPNGSPPLAMYALTQDQSVPTSNGGSTTVPAESIGTTSLIDTAYNNSNGHAQIYIKGYVYAPTVQMVLRLENSSGQVFNWGVIVKDLRLRLNGSSPTQPVFQLPKPDTGVGTTVTTSTPAPSTIVNSVTATVTTYTIRYVNVWTCTVNQLDSSGNCPHTGTPNVQLRVLTDANGAPQKVLSWNQIRG